MPLDLSDDKYIVFKNYFIENRAIHQHNTRQTKDLHNAHANTALAITPSHQQNTHDFADGRKNINDIFNNYVCSASLVRLGLHFQNV